MNSKIFSRWVDLWLLYCCLCIVQLVHENTGLLNQMRPFTMILMTFLDMDVRHCSILCLQGGHSLQGTLSSHLKADYFAILSRLSGTTRQTLPKASNISTSATTTIHAWFWQQMLLLSKQSPACIMVRISFCDWPPSTTKLGNTHRCLQRWERPEILRCSTCARARV